MVPKGCDEESPSYSVLWHQPQSSLRNQCFQVSQTTPKLKNPGNTGNPHSCLVFSLSFRPLCSWGRVLKEAANTLFRKLSQPQLHASSQFFKGFVTSAQNFSAFFWTEIYRWTTYPYVQENSRCLYFDTLTYIWHTHQETFPGLFEHDLFNMQKLFLFPMWGYFLSVSSINLYKISSSRGYVLWGAEWQQR